VCTDAGNLRALAGYFVLTTHRRDADTDAFSAFVFTTRRPSPPHEVRPRFVKAAGDAAVGRITAYVLAQLPAMTLSPEERTKITEALGKVTFTASSDAGRFNGLTTREPDHAYFMPRNIARKGNVVAYTTEAGQTFTVELDENDLPKKVTGDHLTIFVGRGVTQSSPYYVPNEDFNRAHVIANRVGGSGYRAAHNLVTTSDEYNQGPMRTAEDNLVEYVDDTAGTAERSTPGAAPVVTFSLEVGLTYADPTDRLVAAKLAQDEHLPDHAPQIREKILEKLREAGISEKLRRVTQTSYRLDKLVIADKGTPGTTQDAGEDLWLLSRFGS